MRLAARFWAVIAPETRSQRGNGTHCTEDGVEVTICERCHEELNREILPKLGHDYKEKITKEATCTEEGRKAQVCERRGEEKPNSEEIIAKAEHTP